MPDSSTQKAGPPATAQPPAIDPRAYLKLIGIGAAVGVPAALAAAKAWAEADATGPAAPSKKDSGPVARPPAS